MENEATEDRKDLEIKDLSELPVDERQRFTKMFGALKKTDAEITVTEDGATEVIPKLPSYEEKDKEVEETKTLQLCPKCGFNLKNEPVKPTEDDKQQYLRCVLGDKLFEKDYNLYNGAMSITFRARNVKQSELILDTMQARIAAGKLSVANVPHYVYEMTRYQLTISVVAIKLRDGEAKTFAPVDKKDLETYGATGVNNLLEYAYDYKFGNWPDALLNSVIQVHREFEKLIEILAGRVMDSDFWTSAGPNSQ